MQRLLPSIALALIIWPALGNSGQAQLVQVGPGYVKAPFVRVYTDPAGGSYVRAPFVQTYTPGYGMGRVHEVPPGAEFGRMEWRALGQAVRDWTVKLDADLNAFPSGEFWKSSLKTGEIARLAPLDRDGPPPEDVRQPLSAIVQNFDSVGNSPDVNRVASLTSFVKLRAALAEYSTPPELRLRQQLSAAARDLYRGLTRFTTAANWQQHLLLSPGMALSEDHLLGNGPMRNRDDLTAALTNFDAASHNEQYFQITGLPAFKATHELLTAYLRQPSVLTPEPETLPRPKPGL